jgi:hypothetical protein
MTHSKGFGKCGRISLTKKTKPQIIDLRLFDYENYFIFLKILLQRGPLSQLNQIKEALPTI